MPTRSILARSLEPVGLNAMGVVAVTDWDAVAPIGQDSGSILPGARSILVVGSGGRTLWDAFVADLVRNPRGLTEEAHPLDAFVKRSIAGTEGALAGISHRWLFAAARAEPFLDFRLLAGLAGLGVQSRLGLLLHPVYGPWLGLRAACFLDLDLPPDAPGGPDPCESCPAPCIPACPGSAFPGGRWSVERCAAFHQESSLCASRCASREACPEGAAHRYPPEEILYHSNRSEGRRWLRQQLGLSPAEDPFEGIDPAWADWAEEGPDAP